MPNKDKQADNFQVYGLVTNAWCPKCGRDHRLRINWMGRGVPRIFCPPCKKTIDKNQALSSDEPEYVIGFTPHYATTPVRYHEPKVAVSEMNLIPHYGR
jgi:hypothetical protein